MSVITEFSSGDVIERTKTRNKGHRIRVNDARYDRVKDGDAAIYDMLRMTYEDFCLMVYLSQMNAVSLSSMPPTCIRDTFRKLLKCDIWDAAHTLAKQQNPKSKIDTLKGKIQAYSEQISSANNAAKKLITTFSINAKTAPEDMSALGTRIASIESALVSGIPPDEYNELLKMKASIDADMASIRLKIRDITQELDNMLRMEYAADDVRNQRESLATRMQDCMATITEYTTKIAGIEIDLRNLTSLDICPMCKQSISDEYKASATEDTNLKIKELENKKAAAEQELQTYNTTIKELDGKLATLARNEELQNSLKILKERLQRYETQHMHTLSKINKPVISENVKDELKAAKTRLEAYREYMALIDKIAECSSALMRLQSEFKDAEHDMKIHTQVRDLFSPAGIQTYALSKRIYAVEASINTMLSIMGYNRYKLYFNIEDRTPPDGLTLTSIKNGVEIYAIKNDGNASPISVLSGGERAMVDILMRLAMILNMNANSRLAVCIIDEGISAMDDSNQRAVSALFDWFITVFDQVIMISHLESVFNEADNIVTIG